MLVIKVLENSKIYDVSVNKINEFKTKFKQLLNFSACFILFILIVETELRGCMKVSLNVKYYISNKNYIKHKFYT